MNKLEIGFSAHTDEIFLRFPYDRDLVDFLKGFPYDTRSWDKKAKIWKLRVPYFPGLADYILARWGVDLTPERSLPTDHVPLMLLADFLGKPVDEPLFDPELEGFKAHVSETLSE